MRFDDDNELHISDEELVLQTREGCEKAVSLLISRYTSLVRAKVSKYHSTSLEYDDLAQEGMIGLLSAVYAYDIKEKASFKTFASVCIANRISSFVRLSLQKKQIPLNNYSSLDENFIDIDSDPERQVIEKDELHILRDRLYSRLSEKESKVISLYLAGCSYEEIAEKLGISLKSADNALQRVRRKLK